MVVITIINLLSMTVVIFSMLSIRIYVITNVKFVGVMTLVVFDKTRTVIFNIFVFLIILENGNSEFSTIWIVPCANRVVTCKL